MKVDSFNEGVKTRLILSGIQEIEEHGVKDFSLRRVALSAKVSCAAPYRHFKDQDEFIVEIIKYVGSRWELLFKEIKKAVGNDKKSLIKNACVSYIRFFSGNANFKTILLSSPTAITYIGFDDNLLALLEEYYNHAPFAKSRYFSIRAMIYGAILLTGLDNPETVISNLLGALDKEI